MLSLSTQVFRPMGALTRFTQLRHSKVKYKFIFYKDLVPAVTVVIREFKARHTLGD